jgi:Domain of unknown function (DUF4832)/Domain of unknown function (DUF4874)
MIKNLLFPLAVATAILVACKDGTSTPSVARTTVTYTADGTDFPNPERGFYADSYYESGKQMALTTASIKDLISSKATAGYQVSLIHRTYYIPSLINSTHLPASFVQTVDTDLMAARSAGIKLILRFAYRTVALEDCNGITDASEKAACVARAKAEHDPTKQVVLNHLEDLRGTLTNNVDVIAYVDAGLLGTYGEWAYATDQGTGSLLWGFANAPKPDAQYGYSDGGVVNANTQQVIQKFLDVLPGSRAITIRTPSQRISLLQATPDSGVTAPGLNDSYDPRTWVPAQTTITDATAFQNTNLARLGSLNDCFLASGDDAGTYYYANYPNVTSAVQIEKEKEYLSANNLYVPMGGETCGINSDVSAGDYPAYAKKELRRMRWSSLNTDYNTVVLTAMGSTLTEAKTSLGYRFALLSSSVPSTASPNQTINLQFQIRNDGYAAAYNPRNLEVVFTNSGGATVRRNVTLSASSTVNTDPRFWKPATINADGSTTALAYTVNASVPAPESAGDYSVWLNLPDPALPNNPKYSIRLAYNETWDATTGLNPLKQTITVK